MVMEKIQQIHEESHGIYGAPKITECLKNDGYAISQRTVSLYMKELRDSSMLGKSAYDHNVGQ